MALDVEREPYIKISGNISAFHCISMLKIASKLPLVTEESVFPSVISAFSLVQSHVRSLLLLRCVSLNYATDRTRQ